MLFDDDPKYGMGLIWAFFVFVFLMQHLGEPATSQGLVWLPALIVLLPIFLLSAIASAFTGWAAIGGLVLVLLLLGAYWGFAGRLMGDQMVLWGVAAAVILLVAR
jgi:hypothetical protein